ncbi:MAG: YggT family protein [Sulfobacillus benefaciens]|uniref:YggT family protein n=1 Tax=Sulfobacillus benefaciens TaxID=453960 RepID=A0A2T2XFK4_9FIRM|nr:MAG: YggT family protein [Sulfobacillus benefaciens]
MTVILYHLAQTVDILRDLFFVILMVRIIASYVPPRADGIWSFVTTISYRFTEPVLAPIRRRIPLVGMMDLSPLIALFLVDIAGYVLVRLIMGLATL